MIISDSAIYLSSNRTEILEYQRKESMEFFNDEEQLRSTESLIGETPQRSISTMTLSQPSVKVSLSEKGRESALVDSVQSEDDKDIVMDLNIRILRALIERLTGKKIEITRFASVEDNAPQPPQEISQTESNEQTKSGIRYTLSESYLEKESTSFHASGYIKTQDNKEIEFEIDLTMSREFFHQNTITIEEGRVMKDPLVINFGGNAAQLTRNKFSFDIDADGQEDQISFVSPESGFLALDTNKDGTISSGAELFGAVTGDGFAELSVYDDDGNGWIDEKDSIYEGLRIWSKNSSGKDQLVALGQKGVGAIYLGNIVTTFDLKNDMNQQQGQVRSTGVFLSNDSQVGTVQQIDLVV
ncbi:MAG: hypothetical protein V2I36_04525 [Desulfopila sp.]|jgi:hypothetical protein|nr:hypothetical protein [Desulfopila sp.]